MEKRVTVSWTWTCSIEKDVRVLTSFTGVWDSFLLWARSSDTELWIRDTDRVVDVGTYSGSVVRITGDFSNFRAGNRLGLDKRKRDYKEEKNRGNKVGIVWDHLL